MRWCIGFAPNFFRALALIRAASEALIFPALSLRVAAEIARRAWVASFTGKLRPGPAKEPLGSLLRAAAFNLAMLLD